MIHNFMNFQIVTLGYTLFLHIKITLLTFINKLIKVSYLELGLGKESN